MPHIRIKPYPGKSGPPETRLAGEIVKDVVFFKAGR